jgi:hypothetical protein
MNRPEGRPISRVRAALNRHEDRVPDGEELRRVRFESDEFGCREHLRFARLDDAPPDDERFGNGGP